MQTRWFRHALGSVAVVVLVGAAVGAVGCLSRPVVAGEPTTSTNFTTKVNAQAVDKIDLLFSIDNSASMGDKQAYLEQAIPDLITALVTPNCVDATGNPTGQRATSSGTCTTGSPEFPPVHDMHIGIVSSSLGPRLGDQTSAGANAGVCATTGTSSMVTVGGTQYSAHNDDQAHLLTRASTAAVPSPGTTTIPDAPNGFLDWFPTVSANTGKDPGIGAPQVTDPAALGADFQDLVDGIQQYGCGIESQLENWYRFLIQPDPYASLGFTTDPKGTQHATWVGVDTTILQQRKDFLRPDSLVAIIVLTDENDSEIDVRSINGQGYYFMSRGFDPPRGTSICATNPNDPACESCANADAPTNDPSCDAGAYSALNDWGYDINLRHVHTKAKYGIDPQYPIGRYVTGLTSSVVPDRNGEYPSGATSYVGTNNCQNPLFAASLPDPTTLSASVATSATLSTSDENALCKLPAGGRPSDLVFYTIIGGVPHQLLQDSQGNTKSQLDAADWVSILGNDPDHFDYTGIDPHMVESQTPRNGTAADPKNELVSPSSAPTDPISGREWITNQGAHVGFNVDREYACTFKLKTARDCTNPDNLLACDCSTEAGVLTAEELSPVCNPDVVTQQDYAKAYPTIRELSLAKKVGAQGIVASICPIDVEDNDAGDDPNFGYRPAVATIINRLKTALNNECLPKKLTPNAAGVVECLILVSLPKDQSCDQPGLAPPDPGVLAAFVQQQEQTYQQNGGAASGQVDPATQTVCTATQITGATSCKDSPTPGWCYVTGAAAGACAQSILFTPSFPPPGSEINLQCIESANAISGDGG